MRKLQLFFVATAVMTFPLAAAAQTKGDPKRGGKIYRVCVSCHALQPGVHTSGPSLAGVWGRMAGTVKDFVRYSRELRSSGIIWDADTLNTWLSDPGAMVSGTYMRFRGIRDSKARADLIAFLKIAMVPGEVASVVKNGLVPREYTEGQNPDPLKSVPPGVQVTRIRHCGDSYFVTTRDGRETPYWEMNVRLKLDSRATGPDPDKPVILGAGMAGDRVSIIFSKLEELSRFVTEKC